MEHIGIDLGAKHSHIVVMTSATKVVLRKRLQTPALPQWLKDRAASRVVMEACTQSPIIARLAAEAGHETIVLPSTLVRAFGIGARGVKTDDRDAEVLARASVQNEVLPSVHLRGEISRARREVVTARAVLVKARRALALSIKSWLRGRLIVLRGKANSPAFAEAVREAALQHPEGLPTATDLLLGTYEHLCKQISELDRTITELVQDDSICQKLMVIPGVGPQVSLSFITHLDDPGRFADAEHLASYLALVPGESTTGGKIIRTGTLKAGPLYLKALLVQASWSMWRSAPDEPMVLWAKDIAARRGKRIAIVALARKLATVMWTMWRRDVPYDPARASLRH